MCVTEEESTFIFYRFYQSRVFIKIRCLACKYGNNAVWIYIRIILSPFINQRISIRKQRILYHHDRQYIYSGTMLILILVAENCPVFVDNDFDCFILKHVYNYIQY